MVSLIVWLVQLVGVSLGICASLCLWAQFCACLQFLPTELAKHLPRSTGEYQSDSSDWSNVSAQDYFFNRLHDIQVQAIFIEQRATQDVLLRIGWSEGNLTQTGFFEREADDNGLEVLNLLRSPMLQTCFLVLFLILTQAPLRLLSRSNLRCFFVMWCTLAMQSVMYDSRYCFILNVVVRFSLSLALVDSVITAALHGFFSFLFALVAMAEGSVTISERVLFTFEAAAICLTAVVLEQVLRGEVAAQLEACDDYDHGPMDRLTSGSEAQQLVPTSTSVPAGELDTALALNQVEVRRGGMSDEDDHLFRMQASEVVAAGKFLRQIMSQRTPTIEEDSALSAAAAFVPLDLQATAADVVVWLACDNRFTIEKCTPRFADIIGPAAVNGRAALLDYVHKKDRLGVMSFLQREVSEFWASDDKDEEEQEDQPLEILEFRMLTRGILLHVHAEVMVEIPDRAEDEELVIIRFMQWREISNKEQRRRKRIMQSWQRRHSSRQMPQPEQGQQADSSDGHIFLSAIDGQRPTLAGTVQGHSTYDLPCNLASSTCPQLPGT